MTEQHQRVNKHVSQKQARSTSLTFTGTDTFVRTILVEDLLAVIVAARSHVVARDRTRVSARVDTRIHQRNHARFDHRFHTGQRLHARVHTGVLGHRRAWSDCDTGQRLHARVHAGVLVHRSAWTECHGWETADVAEVVDLAIPQDRHAVKKCRKKKEGERCCQLNG